MTYVANGNIFTLKILYLEHLMIKNLMAIVSLMMNADQVKVSSQVEKTTASLNIHQTTVQSARRPGRESYTRENKP